MSENLKENHPSIKSYVYRQGRLTTRQKNALDHSDAHRFPAYVAKNLKGFSRPAVLEIGFGNGQSLVRQAALNPDMDFIGIEIYPPGVGQAIAASQALGLNNLFVFQGDLDAFLQEPHMPQWTKIQIFFPDPWHKRRHHKRRLVTAERLNQLAQTLCVGGLMHVVTDWDDYADFIHESFAGAWRLKCASVLPTLKRETTKYEARAKRLGHRIHEFIYVKI